MIPSSSPSWLFSQLDETERKSLEQLLQPRRFRAGESVFRSGDPAQSMYFVKSGHLHVVLDSRGGDRLVVAEISSGEMLGELSFFDRQPRLSSAEVVEDAELLECSYPTLLEFLTKHPHAAWDMLSVMGRRLRKADELLQRHAVRGASRVENERPLTAGERVSDRVVAFGGSWAFLIVFLLTLGAWIVVNTELVLKRPFDPYPYILLNLALSLVAAVQAPIFLMSQNRQSSVDRARAELNYQVNLKAEVEIAELHRKIDVLDRRVRNQGIRASAPPAEASPEGLS
jgi:CRP/FNR family transcriptional regulator, cyclic AMP receptor protein